MFTRFTNWVKAVSTKTAYAVSHPQVLFSEYSEEVHARGWARTMAE